MSDPRKQKSHDSDAGFYKKRHLSPEEKEKQETITALTSIPNALVRIIDAYEKELSPGEMTRLIILNKELLERCDFQNFQNCEQHVFRFNPLTVVLESTDAHATPQAKFTFIKHLLTEYNMSNYLDAPSAKHMSPLMLASRQGNAPAVELLLDCGARLNIYSDKENHAINYAMHGLISHSKQTPPFQDHEKCAKLILQESFLGDKDHYSDATLVFNIAMLHLDKKKYPSMYAMKKCLSKIDFNDIARAFDSKMTPFEFFIQRLDKAKSTCEHRHSLFPADKLGIELIDALKAKASRLIESNPTTKQFYEFLENELRNNPKLNVYCLTKPANPLEKAIFTCQIILRNQQVVLVKEHKDQLETKSEKKGR